MYEPKYVIKEYKKPITKAYADVKENDVLKFEYGDFDNWVTAIVKNIIIEEKDYGGGPVKSVRIEFEYQSGTPEVAYESYKENGTMDVIGRAKPIKKQKVVEEEDALAM